MSEPNTNENKKHIGGRPVGNDDRIRMGKVIRQFRLAAGLEQAMLGNLIGCSGNTVSTWEAGRNGPSLNIIPKLCDTLNMSLYDLMGMEAPTPKLPKDEQRFINNLHALNASHREAVEQLMFQLLTEQEHTERRIIRRCNSRVIYPDQLSSAAGPGAPAPDYVEPEIVYMRASRASERCDLMLKVNGDSMEPDYPDGCRVFVVTGEETPIGEVGVFIVNGEYFIKEHREDRLFSRNRKHSDILFHDDMDIRHYGRVIGIVNEDDILEGEELDRAHEAYEADEE